MSVSYSPQVCGALSTVNTLFDAGNQAINGFTSTLDFSSSISGAAAAAVFAKNLGGVFKPSVKTLDALKAVVAAPLKTGLMLEGLQSILRSQYEANCVETRHQI